MSRITIGDSQLSSDDEHREDEQSAETNSVHDSVHESNEKEVAERFIDGDSYRRFFTDYEKFCMG